MKELRFKEFVTRKVWGPDDTYLAVEVDTQVFEEDGFKEGDEVEVIIRPTKKHETDEMRYVPVKPGHVIDYYYRTDFFGRAEFEFCPVFRNGFLKKVYITPRQQPDKDHGWVVEVDGSVHEFYVSSLCNSKPDHWFGYWCKEHDTLCQVWYVPPEPARLKIVSRFGCAIVLEFWPKEELC